MDDAGKWRLAVAERRDDNSPAFQCRGKFGIAKVPQGRLKTPYRIRRPVFVEMNFSRPGGTHAGGGDDPALKRRAIVGLSLPGRAKAAGSHPQTEWKGTLFLNLFWDGRPRQVAVEFVII